MRRGNAPLLVNNLKSAAAAMVTSFSFSRVIVSIVVVVVAHTHYMNHVMLK